MTRTKWFNGDVGSDSDTDARSINTFLKNFETDNPTATITQLLSYKGGIILVYTLP